MSSGGEGRFFKRKKKNLTHFFDFFFFLSMDYCTASEGDANGLTLRCSIDVDPDYVLYSASTSNKNSSDLRIRFIIKCRVPECKDLCAVFGINLKT